MRRFDTERAVLRDPGLPGPSVAILLALCTRMAADTGLIPSRHQPSLARLAADTGFSRRTVMRHLNGLEHVGWIARARLPLALAAATHTPTAYTVTCPQARDTATPGLGTESPEARDTESPGLGTESPRARVTVAHKSSETTDDSPQHGGDDDLASIAQAELAALSGQPVNKRTGAEAARQILDGRRVRNRAAYLRKAIRDDWRRYLPTPGPPSLAEIQHQLATREEWD